MRISNILTKMIFAWINFYDEVLNKQVKYNAF